jgi:hypothetical protein
MTRKELFIEAKRMSMFFLIVFGAFIQGAYGIHLGISSGDGGGSGSVGINIEAMRDASVDTKATVDEAGIISPLTTIIGPTSLFEETHGVTDTTGKKAQVYVKVVNAPNGLTYDSLVLPQEGSVGAQPWVSAEQWLTVSKADSITCTATASYGASTTSVSLDKATSVDGYYSKAYAGNSGVWAEETGHVTGPFVGTAKVDTLTKTRTANYGSEYDLNMRAVKGSAPTGILGYYVNPTLKIQSAVNAAQTGDIINIASGIYKENIKIDKSLALKGSGKDQTIVDGQGIGSVFTTGTVSPSAKISLSGMKIQNGKATIGAGIFNKATLDVSDCEISANSATDRGGGIFNSLGTVTLTRDILSKNAATNYGGGIYSTGKVNAVDSTISGNKANNGGGIYNTNSLTLTRSIISSNTAASTYGGGISNYGTANVVDSIITGNTAVSSGGGIYNQKSLKLSGGSVDHNAAKNGGGIYNYGSLDMSTPMSYNTASYKGGGIYNDGIFNHTSGSVDHNTATYAGGGIYNYGTTTYTGGDIYNNTAKRGGGGIANMGKVTNTKTLTVTGVSIYNNKALGDGTTDGGKGGGIWSDDSYATVKDCKIFGNTAIFGGGIYDDGNLNLNGGSVDHNTASKLGGGIYHGMSDSIPNAVMTINGTSISYNTAGYGGGICSDSTLVMNGGSVDHNKATSTDGGGIWSYRSLSLKGCTVSYNTANRNGGGIYNIGTLNIDNSYVTNNIANQYGGGISSVGTVNLNSGSIDHNKAAVDGGGIYRAAGSINGNRALVHDNTLTNGQPDNISP